MAWILFSLLSALATACVGLVNQYTKLDGLLLTVWVKAFLFLLLLPSIFWLNLPEDHLFYIFVILSAVISLWCDKVFFDMSSKFGGGVVSRLTPLYVLPLFLIWLVIKPNLLFDYFSNFYVGIGIILSLVGAIYFSSQMRHCVISYAALKAAIPMIFGYAVTSVLGKLAMDHSELHEGVYGYIVLESFFMCLIGFPVMIKKSGKGKFPIVTKPILKGAFYISVAMSVSLISQNYAYALMYDPTFPAAIMMTSPLFILLFYRLVGHKEDVNVWAGLGGVVAVTFLVLMQGLVD